uniref:Uncharacterized protein n=1 Tax=Rhizophora mucronata TaxID=61149 RepID=A0A2P2JL08_RHIMU
MRRNIKLTPLRRAVSTVAGQWHRRSNSATLIGNRKRDKNKRDITN